MEAVIADCTVLKAEASNLNWSLNCIQDDDDADLQSETEAQHASSRIQKRAPRGALRMKFQGMASKSKSTTLKAQTTKDPQHTNNDMHRELQHSTQQQIPNYSGSTVGSVAPARSAVLPAVAYTCKASLYTASFPLNNAALSSRRAPVTKEEAVNSDPAVAE
jgi:hypothetical protein